MSILLQYMQAPDPAYAEANAINTKSIAILFVVILILNYNFCVNLAE